MDTSKIIRGVVSNGRYTVTAPIVKEDYGLYLQIEGVDLPSSYQVDFSNSENSGTSITMIGNSNKVRIPTELIETGKDIFAFLYVVGSDFGRTVYKFRIPNKVRPDRTNEEPTPEEQSVIDQAISALNEAVEQTSADVASADQSAQSASDDADRAEQAKNDASTFAQRSANSAQASADYSSSAQASATASAQSASQSAQIKADVEDLVDDAQASASASAQSATASANSASQAQGYAQSASASAQSASQYASSAQTSANTASNKASEASTSAQTASNKASEASQSASQALSYKTDAESAKTASQTAQGLAESARDSAVQAKTDAESAKDDAVQAKEDAESAVASISGALADKADVITDTASGAIASFSDGAEDLPLKSLIVDIDPVQDLHGQDAPYPAGGGKNLFDANTAVQGYYISNDNGGSIAGDASYASDYIEVDAGQTYRISPTLSSGNWGAWYDENKAFISGLAGYATAKTAPSNAKYLRFTVSRNGSNPNYATTTQVEKGSEATAWSPYENICPISGWTEVDVEQSGVNLFDADAFATMADLTKNEDGSLYVSFNGKVLNKVAWKNVGYTGQIAITYTYKYANANIGGALPLIYYTDGTHEPTSTPSTTEWKTVTKISNASKIVDYVTFSYGTGSNSTTFFLQIELGSTATPYSPYTGRSITINLGQTVYGGKLDVLSGVLTIDRGIAVFNGTENYQDIYFPTIVCTKNVELVGDYSKRGYIIGNYCSAPILGFATPAAKFFQWRLTDTTFGVSSADELKALFAQYYADGNPMTVVYPLATPIEIQLTPNQVNSLLGVNNIWADSGDTEVEYRADTKLFIERLTAPDSADMIADSNIISGQYFMVGNSLYKATANIANGSAIVVGTNCIRKSLSEALNEINA